MKYAAIYDGEKAFTADTLAELVGAVAIFGADNTVKISGYQSREIHAYSSEFTTEEMLRDRAKTVARWIRNGDFPRWRIYSAMT